MRGDQAFLDRHGLGSLLESAMAATRDLFYVYDTDDNLVAWNERLNEVPGYTDAELLAMDLAEFVHPDDRDALREYVDSTWAEAGQVEARLLTADGSAIPYEFFGDPFHEDGDLVGRVGVGRRVTERRTYRRRLERREEQLERVASLISHDVRGPLSTARGHLELYQETGEESHFEDAVAAQDRIEEIVDGVLDVVRLEETVDETRPVPVDEAAVRAWNVGLADRDEGTELELRDPPTVSADRALLCELLENLFRNAEQHSDGGVTVRVGALRDEEGFYVADDGPGIPPSEHEAVFDWGYTGGEDGTGLGLALVDEVVRAHGWRVQVTESDTGGARFELYT